MDNRRHVVLNRDGAEQGKHGIGCTFALSRRRLARSDAHPHAPRDVHHLEPNRHVVANHERRPSRIQHVGPYAFSRAIWEGNLNRDSVISGHEAKAVVLNIRDKVSYAE
jgi:hypothetical protein